MQDGTYELKYCERCGSLRLRRSQSGASYCDPCGQILTNHASPANLARRSLLRKPGTETRPPLKLKLKGEAHPSSLLFGRLQ